MSDSYQVFVIEHSSKGYCEFYPPSKVRFHSHPMFADNYETLEKAIEALKEVEHRKLTEKGSTVVDYGSYSVCRVAVSAYTRATKYSVMINPPNSAHKKIKTARVKKTPKKSTAFLRTLKG